MSHHFLCWALSNPASSLSPFKWILSSGFCTACCQMEMVVSSSDGNESRSHTTFHSKLIALRCSFIPHRFYFVSSKKRERERQWMSESILDFRCLAFLHYAFTEFEQSFCSLVNDADLYRHNHELKYLRRCESFGYGISPISGHLKN